MRALLGDLSLSLLAGYAQKVVEFPGSLVQMAIDLFLNSAHYVAQAGLELTMWSRLAPDLQLPSF